MEPEQQTCLANALFDCKLHLVGCEELLRRLERMGDNDDLNDPELKAINKELFGFTINTTQPVETCDIIPVFSREKTKNILQHALQSKFLIDGLLRKAAKPKSLTQGDAFYFSAWLQYNMLLTEKQFEYIKKSLYDQITRKKSKSLKAIFEQACETMFYPHIGFKRTLLSLEENSLPLDMKKLQNYYSRAQTKELPVLRQLLQLDGNVIEKDYHSSVNNINDIIGSAANKISYICEDVGEFEKYVPGTKQFAPGVQELLNKIDRFNICQKFNGFVACEVTMPSSEQFSAEQIEHLGQIELRITGLKEIELILKYKILARQIQRMPQEIAGFAEQIKATKEKSAQAVDSTVPSQSNSGDAPKSTQQTPAKTMTFVAPTKKETTDAGSDTDNIRKEKVKTRKQPNQAYEEEEEVPAKKVPRRIQVSQSSAKQLEQIYFDFEGGKIPKYKADDLLRIAGTLGFSTTTNGPRHHILSASSPYAAQLESLPGAFFFHTPHKGENPHLGEGPLKAFKNWLDIHGLDPAKIQVIPDNSPAASRPKLIG